MRHWITGAVQAVLGRNLDADIVRRPGTTHILANDRGKIATGTGVQVWREWVRTGQRAVMRVQALPGREFTGSVTFIDPHVNEQTRTLTVRVEFANADLTLKPGMYADVELSASMGRRLMVPESAVLPTGLRNIVFVDHGEGRMEIRNVQLGAKVSDHFEILGGLVEGELVVISGNFLIDAESKLQAAEPVWGGENPQ